MDYTGYRLLAVHAHPDDESSKGAATNAQITRGGGQVLVVTCTGGERGSILNPQYPKQELTLEEIAAARRIEMANAAKILGIDQVWMGYEDSGFPEGDPLPPLPDGSFATLPVSEPAVKLAQIIRDFRPHVLTTYDPAGGYPHPDHIMTHTVSVAALALAAGRGDADDLQQLTGDVWQPAKVYYNHGFSMERLRAIHEEMLAQGMESPYGDWITARIARETPERKATTRIECAEFFPLRDQALLAHETQIDPDGHFFMAPREVEIKVWPWEEYELAGAVVDVELPETDLFAGVSLEYDGMPRDYTYREGFDA